MPRSITAICGVPFRKIVGHADKEAGPFHKSLSGRIELLSCGHKTLCKEGNHGFCCASQRRCYTCKYEGYESPKNRKIRLANERRDKEMEPFLEENQK